MSKILCIDTATDICSVALAEDGVVVAFRDSENERSHAKMLAVFIDELLKTASLRVADLDAVAISMGPGSYTGLRIGVSTAKGICYGANKPLIAISTLEAMCYGVEKEFLLWNNLSDFYFCPMIDARRMEVYTALFDSKVKNTMQIQAMVVDENSFKECLEKKPVLFFGSGAQKLTPIFKQANALFYHDFKHSASYMGKMVEEKFMKKDFEDVAYFEPFYLKDFITTTPKNKSI